MVNGLANPWGYLALVGGLVFLGGFVTLFVQREQLERIEAPLLVCGVGFACAAIGAVMKERVRTRHWVPVRARCLDHEVRFGRTPNGARIGVVRALCAFPFEGETVQCTPEASWSRRRGEEGALQFIHGSAEEGFHCHLRVNPKNPRQVVFQRSVSSSE